MRVDAVVPGDALTLALAEELEQLAPFGQGNRPVNLLVPAALLDEPRPMGEGRHVAFTLAAGGARSRCVLFGAGTRLPAEPGEPVGAIVELEANRYNGTVEPRLVLRHAHRAVQRPIELVGEHDWRAGLLGELDRDLDAAADPVAPGGRELLDRRDAGIAGVLADLVASGRAPCSRSSRTRRTARGSCATAPAASRSAPGTRSRTTPSWRAATRTSSPSIRPGGAGSSTIRPGRAGPTWPGVSLSYALPHEFINGTSPCATR